jgi:hypothetical protein
MFLRRYMYSLYVHFAFLRGTGDFTPAQKEFVLRTFIALKNPLSSAGFEPTNLVFNDRHDNH